MINEKAWEIPSFCSIYAFTFLNSVNKIFIINFGFNRFQSRKTSSKSFSEIPVNLSIVSFVAPLESFETRY